MSIPPGGEIGTEEHAKVEQTLVVVSGRAQLVAGGRQQLFGPGDTVVVPPGTPHNLVNVGSEPLKLYTVYTPPNHLEGRVQKTRQDAQNDAADEAFGKRVNRE